MCNDNHQQAPTCNFPEWRNAISIDSQVAASFNQEIRPQVVARVAVQFSTGEEGVLIN